MNNQKDLRVGSSVQAMFLRFDESAGQAVLQLPGDVPAYLSVYDMTDETFDNLRPGDFLEVIVERVDASCSAAYAVVVHEATAQIP